MPPDGPTGRRQRPPPRAATPPHRLALLVEPRFPGGTSAAVAAELRALAGHVRLQIFDLGTAMFQGRTVNRRLADTVEDAGLVLSHGEPVVRADTVVMHNPACLKFDRNVGIRISCRTLVVVAHENFLRPGGGEGFDVGHCLDLIEAASICHRRLVAPISAPNRRGVADWLAHRSPGWELAPFDWPYIYDMPTSAPTAAPRDRRGRHSRPGLEKFPSRDRLLVQFPSHAERCVLLGADMLLDDSASPPPHWELRRFGTLPVPQFLQSVDFLIYFTNPAWQESFGRAIAEAIAAGKVVITDRATAEPFGDAVVAAEDHEIDGIISRFVAAPDAYRRFVVGAQAWLTVQGPERFREIVLPGLGAIGGDDAVL